MDMEFYTESVRRKMQNNCSQPGELVSELQTGMAVQFASAKKVLMWILVQQKSSECRENSIRYGLFQRYPSGKTTATGHIASAHLWDFAMWVRNIRHKNESLGMWFGRI